MTDTLEARRDIGRKLFSASPLKQKKLAVLLELSDSFEGRSNLDIGSDNGVISFLLREKGGQWCSADLLDSTVEAIRSLCPEDVFQIQSARLPELEQESFDQILLVDMLEHLEDDKGFLEELNRLLKPGGTLIINVPNPKEGPIRRLRDLLGQTDEVHGHLRPGYSRAELETMLGEGYALEDERSYSRLFSVLTDTVVNAGIDLLGVAKKGKKGRVVTSDALKKAEKMFLFYRILSPFLRFATWLDDLFPFTAPNMLAIRCRKL